MGTALQKAISLILSSDAELLNILKVTAQMSLKSSLLALLLGVPLGRPRQYAYGDGTLGCD